MPLLSTYLSIKEEIGYVNLGEVTPKLYPQLGYELTGLCTSDNAGGGLRASGGHGKPLLFLLLEK